MKLGKFIVLEGLDGSGKTTQINRLGAQLASAGVLLTREPTNGPIGKLCRSALLGNTPLSQDALALLFAADRAQHLLTEIRPALDAGTHVICDRYIYSNMAFQGDAVPLEKIFAYNENALIPPDLTIFIDTSPEECSRRISNSRTQTEIYDGTALSKKIRLRYLRAFNDYGKIMPVTQVDGNLSAENLVEIINSLIIEKIK